MSYYGFCIDGPKERDVVKLEQKPRCGTIVRFPIREKPLYCRDMNSSPGHSLNRMACYVYEVVPNNRYDFERGIDIRLKYRGRVN